MDQSYQRTWSVKCTLIKFAGDSKLEGTSWHVERQVCHSEQPRGMGRQELYEFQQNKCKDLLLGRNNSLQHYRVGTDQLESTSAGKDLKALVDRKLNTSQQWQHLELFNRSIARQLKEVITCLYLAFVLFWLPNTRKILINWSEFSGGHQGNQGVGELGLWGEAVGLGLVQSGEEMALEGLDCSPPALPTG